MIKYSKKYYGLALLFQLFGSAVPRALPFALVAGALAFVLKICIGDYLEANWKHPFPYQAVAFVVGFLVSFRCAASRAANDSTWQPNGHASPAARMAAAAPQTPSL